jgi:MFS family permease
VGKNPKQSGIRRLLANFSFLKGNVLIIILSWIVWYPALGLIGGYSQLYIYALGASAIIVGAINSISTVTLSVVRILGGYIADRFGRKNILISMSLASAFTYLIYALAPNWQWVLIAATLNSVFLLYQPALIALRYDSVPSDKRGFGFALTEFLPGLVSLPAPFIAIYLVLTNGTVGGMRIAYLVAFALGIFAAVLWLFLKETLPQRNDKRASFHSDFKKEYSEAIRFIFKKMRSIALLYILFNLAYTGAGPFFPIYAKSFLKLGDFGWGAMYAVSFILNFALLIPVGLATDKIGEKRMLLAGIGFLSLFSLIYATALSNEPFSLLIMVLSYTAIILAYAGYAKAVAKLEADFIPREKRGRVTAALSFVALLAGAAGLALGGFEYYLISPRFPFVVLTALMALSFIVVLFRIKQPETPEQ